MPCNGYANPLSQTISNPAHCILPDKGKHLRYHSGTILHYLLLFCAACVSTLLRQRINEFVTSNAQTQNPRLKILIFNLFTRLFFIVDDVALSKNYNLHGAKSLSARIASTIRAPYNYSIIVKYFIAF